MKILVTGGAGYIGSHTVVELASAGYEPVIVDNFCNSRPEVIDRLKEITGLDLVCHEGDCANTDFMERIFEAERDIKGAIHFAALKSVGESMQKPDLYRKNNIGSLHTLMAAMHCFCAPFLVFSSSACVYGEADELPVTEETPLKEPASVYGETKQACERFIEEAIQDGAKICAVSLRYFNPIGAHSSAKIGELPLGIPNNLVPFLTQTAAGNLPQLTVFGSDYNTPDGTAVRDYIHVVDLAKAHVCALKYLEGRGGAACRTPTTHVVFNLGTGKGNSVLEVIRTFEQATGVKVNYVIGPRRAGDVEAIYANCDKAGRELGWKIELTLADGLRDAWKWQKEIQG